MLAEHHFRNGGNQRNAATKTPLSRSAGEGQGEGDRGDKTAGLPKQPPPSS